METSFTPIASLAGGILIGLAAVALMALHGRILGATGILTGALFPTSRHDWKWRVAMLAGMVCGPLVYLVITGQFPEISVPASLPLLAVGGVLVGLGVTFGGGCTSGHGVCGMARLSVRSVTATLTFMMATGVTVYISRHVVGG